MWKRNFGGLLLFAALPWLSVLAQAPVTELDVLVISLKANATVSRSVVRLSDVAVLEGGAASLQKKAAYLDLADLSAGRATTLVPRDLVMIRLRLAGVAEGQFR